MQNKDSAMIVGRFFLALQRLKQDRAIRGKQTFTRRYGINRWNFLTLEKEQSRDIFQVSWLSYLVSDYGVNAEWLLLGTGEFYTDTEEKTADKPQEGESTRRTADITR